MSSPIKPLWEPEEGQDYIFKKGEVVIKTDNTFEEILCHIMLEMGGSVTHRMEAIHQILDTMSISEVEAYLKRFET